MKLFFFVLVNDFWDFFKDDITGLITVYVKIEGYRSVENFFFLTMLFVSF